ncbi:multidrug effflux MFS transporter [Rhodospirillaceae bacterium SYSU D60014]|uniref:multidrug effflux MFS transporter n=1 Tax=Virgifigura deserti TaxID=2268457 RepID=UPI000E663AC1
MSRSSDAPKSDGAVKPDGAIPFGEFVTLIALMMAMTALAIDIMLPALPNIAQVFDIVEPNDRQLLVTTYMLGFAVGQPLSGPLSDRFGRKPVLYVGLLLYAVGSLGALAGAGFEVLLWSRALQGLGAAAPRIMAIAIVRDRFGGRDMARVMSLVMMVFIIVPVLAPAIGEAILHFGPWSWIFWFLLVVSLIVLLWTALRLPETLPSGDRLPLSATALGAAITTTVKSRPTLGYTVAVGFMFGSLMSYIGSAQQIFVDIYQMGELFPLAFGAIAAFMALASFTNARLVGQLGMRRVSHAALLGFLLSCGLMALAGFPEKPPLFAFCAFLAAAFFFFGLMAPNFNALAMEPLGHIAGVASSFVGFYATAASAFFGWIVGQEFDGTVRPLAIGFTVMAVLALFTVLWTERGRLFTSRDMPARGSR